MTGFSEVTGSFHVNRSQSSTSRFQSTLTGGKSAPIRAAGTPLPSPSAPMSNTGSIFLLDRSGSMSEPLAKGKSKMHGALKASRLYALAACERDPNHVFALVAFNDDAETLIEPTPVAAATVTLEPTLSTVSPTGGTNFVEALRAAGRITDAHPGVRFEIILVTDGKHTAWRDPVKTATALKARGHGIAAIGVGAEPEEVDTDRLLRIASEVNGKPAYEFCADLMSFTSQSQELGRLVQVASRW